MAERGDDELLLAARTDAAAFAALYRRHARPLTGFLLARTRDAETAADLAAETFAAALAGLHRFRPERGDGAAWLYGIARHQLARWQRRGAVDQRARRRLGMERLALDDEALARVEDLADVDARGWLEDLPPEQAAAVRARVLEQRGYDEVAAAGGTSEAAARQRVSRGLAALRARLRGELE